MRKDNIAYHKFFMKVSFVLPGSHFGLFVLYAILIDKERLAYQYPKFIKVGCDIFW